MLERVELNSLDRQRRDAKYKPLSAVICRFLWGDVRLSGVIDLHSHIVISRVAADLDLDALAKKTPALVRRRGVLDAKALLRLALARGPGGMSLRRTAAWAHLSGVADLDRRLAQRPSASVLRLPRGYRRETAGGSNAFALHALAETQFADRGWELRQQAGQSRHGLARAWRL